jgi:hypothetical protein
MKASFVLLLLFALPVTNTGAKYSAECHQPVACSSQNNSNMPMDYS